MITMPAWVRLGPPIASTRRPVMLAPVLWAIVRAVRVLPQRDLGRQRPPGARRHRAKPRKYLSQAIFQYRISGDAIVKSCRAKASRLSPNEIGLPMGSGMLVDLASSGGSSKAERGPLIVPT